MKFADGLASSSYTYGIAAWRAGTTKPRLDPVNQTVQTDDQRIQLTPKAFAVLDHLRRRPGQLVTKQELLDAVWPRVHVGDAVLKVAVREIRRTLQDEPRTPRFIETVHRRGYRFIGELPVVDRSAGPPDSRQLTATATGLVGRRHELALLDDEWRQARQGHCRVVFVSGEPGIGKSTLVEGWLGSLTGEENLLCGKGLCLEQQDGGEAYLPVLDALGRLCRGSFSVRLQELLRKHAPNWLMQLPWLVDAAERETLRQSLFGSTRNRMLREFAELVETLTKDIPLLLVLEDLHWSDPATLELLAYLAHREEPNRLCVIGTLRSGDADLSEHPLSRLHQELRLHRRCRELALSGFTAAELALYLQQRLPGAAIPESLTATLYRRTSGHPLFLADAVDHLVTAEVLESGAAGWRLRIPAQEVEIRMPADLRQVFARQLAGLDLAERRVLEAACTVGGDFSAAAVAAILETDVLEIEDICEALARHGPWLQKAEARDWPDGTVAEWYRFSHALRRDFLYESLPAGRCQHLHRRLARRLETAYGDQATGIAADLAHHCERGGDHDRAVHYLQQAAAVDNARFAHREAARHLERAIDLLEQLPAEEAMPLRSALLQQRCAALMAAGRLDQVIAGYRELAELARRHGNPAEETRALLGLGGALFWIDRERCLETAETALARFPDQADPLLKAHARGLHAHWQCLIRGYRPEHEVDYLAAVEEARKAGDPSLECQHRAFYAYLLCLRSRYRDACREAETGLQLARRTGDGHQYLSCQFFRAWGLFYGGHWGRMAAVMDDALTLATRNGNWPWVAHFRLQQAWLLAQVFDHAGARALCEPVLAGARAAHSPGSEYFLGLILSARTHLGQGRVELAGASLDEIDAQLKNAPHAIDWVLRLPLQLTLAEYWLARRDQVKAHAAAEALYELATGPMEHTYYTLALVLLAEIAIDCEQSDRIEARLSRLSRALEEGDAPVAAWRAHATAARGYELLAQRETARRCWYRSAAALTGLAQSMDASSPLRTTFEGHPMVRAILARAAGG